MEDLLIIVPRQSIDQQTQTDPLNISLYMDRSTQVDIERSSRKRSNSRKPSLSRSGLFLLDQSNSKLPDEKYLLQASNNGALVAN